MSFKQLVIGASGIYISYLTISIVSQKLYSTSYPSIKNPEQFDKFTYPSLIVWFSGLLCAIYGYIKGKVSNQVPNPIPTKQQLILGVLYSINIFSANYALLYITYLEQTLGRNCRYLMVVIIGAYFSRVKKGSDLKIPPKKIFVASIITIGVLFFTVFGSSNKHATHLDTGNHWKGYVILAISIIADALFSDSQAYSKFHFKPTSNHLFTSASLYSFIFVLIISFILGEGFQQIHFCINHPTAIIDGIIMAVLQVVGQVSIYYVIVNFKQHIFPLISTTRKVLTVLLSIVIYGHNVNGLQWLSIFMVFGGLVYQLQQQLQGKHKKDQKGDKQIKSSDAAHLLNNVSGSSTKKD